MKLPLFPLNTVLFPGALLPIHIFEERYKALVKYCLRENVQFAVVLIKEGREVTGPSVPYSIGVLARITQVEELQEGRYNILCQGEERFRITALDRRSAEYLQADIELLPDEPAPAAALAMVADRVATLFDEYYRLMVALMGGWQRESGHGEPTWMFDAGMLAEKQAQIQTTRVLDRVEDGAPVMPVPVLPEDPTALANIVASEMSTHVSVKQDLLEAPSALARLQREAELLTRETATLGERLHAQHRMRFTAFGTAN